MEHNTLELDSKEKSLANLARSILPIELWVEIFPYLSVSAILNCLRSCKGFEHIYLALLSAKRNHFIVGRVHRYGDAFLNSGTLTDSEMLLLDVLVGHGTMKELSKLCFASCTLIMVRSDTYTSPSTMPNPPYFSNWDWQRVITNAYIAMGSPNIIACYTEVNNNEADKKAYERFKADIENVAQIVLGRNFQHFKTIPLPKKYSPKTNKMVEWYKGPTLKELIGQSNQFLPPLTLRQALAKPDYLRYEERVTQLCMTVAGVQESPVSHIKCPIMPYMPWVHPLKPNDPVYYTMDSSSSLTYYPSVGSRPGNCLVSIAVLQNTLRNHFENEIYILGLKRYIHIHLLFEIKEGKVNFVDQVYPGENCMAVATITAEKIVTYKQPKDPKLKSSYGKFVANDHASEVFYGVVVKFDKYHEGDFFDGDAPAAYNRPNVLRQRRRQVILDKEAERKARVKEQRAKRKAAKGSKGNAKK